MYLSSTFIFVTLRAFMVKGIAFGETLHVLTRCLHDKAFKNPISRRHRWLQTTPKENKVFLPLLIFGLRSLQQNQSCVE